jgi:hypothetical protein
MHLQRKDNIKNNTKTLFGQAVNHSNLNRLGPFRCVMIRSYVSVYWPLTQLFTKYKYIWYFGYSVSTLCWVIIRPIYLVLYLVKSCVRRHHTNTQDLINTQWNGPKRF